MQRMTYGFIGCLLLVALTLGGCDLFGSDGGGGGNEGSDDGGRVAVPNHIEDFYT